MADKTMKRSAIEGALIWAVLGWLWGVGSALWILARNDALDGPWPTVATVFGVAPMAGAFCAALLGLLFGIIIVGRVENEARVAVSVFIAGVTGWVVYTFSVNKDLAIWAVAAIRVAAVVMAVTFFFATRLIAGKFHGTAGKYSRVIFIAWVLLATLVEIPLVARWYSLRRPNAPPEDVQIEEVRNTAVAPKFHPLDKFPKRDEADRGKVLILGIDALTWDRLGPLMEAGRLPNFERLMKQSAYGKMATIEPPLSPRIWTTISTGRMPKQHGIEDFVLYHYEFLDRWKRLRVPSEISFLKYFLEPFNRKATIPISNAQRKVKALWNIATEAGIGVGVVDWWASWPPEEVKGFVVTDHAYFDDVAENVERGWFSRAIRGDLTYPPALYGQIEQFYRPLNSVTPELVESFVNLGSVSPSEFSRMLEKNPRNRHENPLRTIAMAILHDNFYAESALHLMKTRGQPELMMVYLRATDWVSHAAWLYSVPEAADRGLDKNLIDIYSGSVNATYIFADEWLGKFLDAVEPGTTVIVCSDHGFGPDPRDKSGYGHYVPYPGAVFVTGPYVKPGVEILDADVKDVAVNVLTWLGMPIAMDMVGKPWRGIMNDEWLERHPARRIETYEAGMIEGVAGFSSEDGQMIDRLKALGYVQ